MADDRSEWMSEDEAPSQRPSLEDEVSRRGARPRARARAPIANQRSDLSPAGALSLHGARVQENLLGVRAREDFPRHDRARPTTLAASAVDAQHARPGSSPAASCEPQDITSGRRHRRRWPPPPPPRAP